MGVQRIREHVLIIVQNLPVPLDRRVWLECQALVAAGYAVSVICPKGPGDPAYQEIDGVHIHKYTPAPGVRGPLGFAFEFCYAWLRTALLAARIWRRRPFSAIQACNPPDTYALLARIYRPCGVRFVYDQHDLCPEVYRSRFGRNRGLLLRTLLLLERITYRTASHVIATNDSYRAIAMERGERDAHAVTVVRSGPDTSRMRRGEPDPTLRKGARHLLCWLGIMGPQDGVENVLRMMDRLVHIMGRRDVHVALLGFGDCLDDLQRLSSELGLDEWVTFTGRVEAPEIARYLSTADVGLSPDPFNPLNDLSTMNKTMEYMAFGLPVVAFGLKETRVSAGDAAVYVEPDDVDGFAAAVAQLLDDPPRRALLGKRGRDRAVQLLDWTMQAGKYVGVYHQLLRGDRRFVLLPTGERIIDRRAAERRRPTPALHVVGSPGPDRRRDNRRSGPDVRLAATSVA